MHPRQTRIALGLSLLLCASCARPGARPTQLPEFPDALARPHPAAWVAFELTLDVDGGVAPGRVRLVGWDASGAPAPLYVALWTVASGTIWGPPRSGKSPQRVELVLDGSGRPLVGAAIPKAVQARLAESIRVRRAAFEALRRGSHADGNLPPDHDPGPEDAHDLDCAWMRLAGLRSGAPFLHDDVRGWSELKPSLLAAEQADGGLWVCRLTRRTHSGQFVFLNADRRVLGIRRYILGE